jgi:hypothetical protein
MTDVLVVGCVCLNPLSFAGVEICSAPRGQNVHDAMRCSRPRGHHGASEIKQTSPFAEFIENFEP